MTFFPIVDECGGHFGPVDETGILIYFALIYIIDELFSVRILFKMSAEFGGHQQNSAGIFSTFLTRKKQMTAEFFKSTNRILDVHSAIWLAKDPLLANVTKRIRVVMQIFVFS